MASLVNLSFDLRLVLKILAGFRAGVFVLFLLYSGFVFAKNQFFPEPPPPPEVKFGKIPDVSFPLQEKSSVGFKVNTKSGDLPADFPDRIKVYKNKGFEPSLTALQDARSRVEGLLFNNREEKVSETTFRWAKVTGETLSLDIYTNDFTVDSNFLFFPEVYSSGSFALTKDRLTSVITAFLGGLEIDVSNFDFDVTRVKYYKIANNTLEQVESQNDAQIARVDLFQKRVDDKPIFYPEYNGSTMHFFIGEREGALQITKAEFYQHITNAEESSTYPIIPVQKALDDLARGKGLILTEKPLFSKTFEITDVNLVYYYGKNDTGYLNPIYVFYGSDFFAIVNALSPDLISNETDGTNN